MMQPSPVYTAARRDHDDTFMTTNQARDRGGPDLGHYHADLTAGSLKLQESRIIADLLLRRIGEEGWKTAIVTENVLQARNPATAIRLARLIRQRLETMGDDLWRLVRDGNNIIATHAVLAAAVKHSALLADFLDLASLAANEN